MPGRKPEKIEQSEKVRQAREKLAARHTTGQQKAQRARIILKAAAGQKHAEIAQALKGSVAMAWLWRRRWLALQDLGLDEVSVEARLEDWPRPGAPARLTADQVCQIEHMACQGPEKAGRPIRQWTGREIADELVKRGIVKSISPHHAARLLKKGASKRT